jgi:hypothetical protein
MFTVWHVDKYKITFKLVINHWTNEILEHILQTVPIWQATEHRHSTGRGGGVLHT